MSWTWLPALLTGGREGSPRFALLASSFCSTSYTAFIPTHKIFPSHCGAASEQLCGAGLPAEKNSWKVARTKVCLVK